MVVYFGLSTSH